jgi:hypothetical protein
MRRVLTVAVVAAAVGLLAATPAEAGPPTIERFPKGTFDLGNLNDGPTGPVCPFPVGLVVHAISPGHVITFDGQGVGFAAMNFGAFRLTITNLDTGDSVTVNSSGPGGVGTSGLNVIGRGTWTTFEPIAEGGLRYTRGLTMFVPVSYGVHAVPIAGTEEDLCDRVA